MTKLADVLLFDNRCFYSYLLYVCGKVYANDSSSAFLIGARVRRQLHTISVDQSFRSMITVLFCIYFLDSERSFHYMCQFTPGLCISFHISKYEEEVVKFDIRLVQWQKVILSTFLSCLRLEELPSCHCKGFRIPVFHLFLTSFTDCGSERSDLVATGGSGLDNISLNSSVTIASKVGNYMHMFMRRYTCPNLLGFPQYTFLMPKGSFG